MAEPNEVHIFPEGTVIAGSYEVVRPIARGGMAIVYEVRIDLRNFNFAALLAHYFLRVEGKSGARDWQPLYEHWKEQPIDVQRKTAEQNEIPFPGRDRCALKVLTSDSSKLERFYGEWQRIITCRIPNTVEVYEGGRWQSHYYYVMELIERVVPFERILRMEIPQKLEIVLKSAQGLRALHGMGMIHRDVKPSNIFVYSDSDDKVQVKIGDLGIAKHADFAITFQKDVIGTPGYMSPEQARESRKVDERTDIYGLGATLYHFATGVAPYHTEKNTPSLLIKLGSGVPPTPVRQINPSVPQPVASLINKMMAMHPEDRFRDMEDLVDAVESILYPGRPRKPKPRARPSQTQRVSAASRESKAELLFRFAVAAAAVFLFAFWVFGTKRPADRQTAEPAPTAPSEKIELSSEIRSYLLSHGEKDYAQCLQSLARIERAAESSALPDAGDPVSRLALFVSSFHRGKWEEAMQMVPEIWQNKETGDLGRIFCLRLMLCHGEYHLLSWDAPRFYDSLPEYYSRLPYPLLDTFRGEYQRAWEKLAFWQPEGKLASLEKKLNEVMLHVVMQRIQRDVKLDRAQAVLSESAQMESLPFRQLYAIWREDYASYSPETTKKYLALGGQFPFLVEPSYRCAMLFLEKNKFQESRELLDSLTRKHPDFQLARIANGDFGFLDQNCDLGDDSSAKNALYSNVLGNLGVGQTEKAGHAAELLMRHFPYWGFSYHYGALTSLRLQVRNRAVDLSLQSLRVSAARMHSHHVSLLDQYLGAFQEAFSPYILEYGIWLLEQTSPEGDPGTAQSLQVLRGWISNSSLAPYHLDSASDPAALQKFALEAQEGKFENSNLHPFVYGVIARSLLRTGRTAEAMQFLERASMLWNRMEPGLQNNFFADIKNHKGYHYFTQGTVCLEASRKESGSAAGESLRRAFVYFQWALAMDPFFNRDALFARQLERIADGFLETGDIRRARSVLRWCLENLARGRSPFLMRQIRIAESERELEKASSIYSLLKRGSMDPAIFLASAKIEGSLKRTTAARRDLRFALYLLDLLPDDANRREQRREIETLLAFSQERR